MLNCWINEGSASTIAKRLNKKNTICINVFCYENNLTYPVYIFKQKFEDCMDLLLSNFYIKDFDIFIFNKIKHKNQKHFCRHCLKRFSNERVLMQHRTICLKTNGKHSINQKKVKLNLKTV